MRGDFILTSETANFGSGRPQVPEGEGSRIAPHTHSHTDSRVFDDGLTPRVVES
jgi:hypothetical protein